MKCVSETSTIAVAYIDKYDVVSTPVDDGGVIVDRVLVDIDNIYPWLREQEEKGCVLAAQTLAGLFYLNERCL